MPRGEPIVEAAIRAFCIAFIVQGLHGVPCHLIDPPHGRFRSVLAPDAVAVLPHVDQFHARRFVVIIILVRDPGGDVHLKCIHRMRFDVGHSFTKES